VLLFKAYGEFFQGSFFACLDTYEEYEAYIKDLFGRDSDVLYNKTLCEGLLMADNDLHEDALAKYGACLDIYYQKHGSVPPEPLLYKLALLVRLSLRTSTREHSLSQADILEEAIELMESYQAVLGSHPLALYFRGLICLLLGQLEGSREWLDKALKVAEDCSWKWLWVKGALEVQLGNYYEAVKEFSAGLILDNRPELYLGRSVAFLLLS
jgi:tetratricopeptide (TPR) repeat protein